MHKITIENDQTVACKVVREILSVAACRKKNVEGSIRNMFGFGWNTIQIYLTSEMEG